MDYSEKRGIPMKLLIVEDEESTLMGLSTILDWSCYGIESVFLASNGEKGLLAAREHRPEIVLTDIRMPRMDGISMAEKIRGFLPETQIIFLSAYQEIDYYKAAIALKAVNYIEKPVMAEDMEKVLREAVANLQKNNLLQQAASATQARIRENIAQRLLLPNVTLTAEQTEYLRRKGTLETITYGYITTVLIWLHEETGDNPASIVMKLVRELASHQAAARMEVLGTQHEHNCLAVHFFAEQADEFTAHKTALISVFHRVLKEEPTYYITVGKMAHGIQNAFQSWQNAVILLQEAFYEPFKSVKFYCKDQKVLFGNTFYQKEKEEILHYIAEQQQEEILAEEESLYRKMKQECSMMPVNVRNMYAVFLYGLERQAELIHISAKEELSPEKWQGRLEWANLDMLHELFKETTAAFFEAVKSSQGQQSLIRQIHSYIDQNYANDMLSLKEISEYVHMSNSHMCTFYKQETGGTINQYLTQVRMEKARYYLKATNYSISDIAARTGYRESSYFGRIFKKTYDLTPAEYRAQCKEFK